MNLVRPIAFALVTANLINFLGNYILIFGKFGFHAYGVTGSGIATCISRGYLALVLVVYLLWYDRRHKTGLLNTPLQPNLNRIRQLIALGVPAALQQTAEVTVFALVATLIARLGAVAQAGHQVALNTVAFTYMVPLGLSSAAAVRVGQALGRRDPAGARNAGNAGIPKSPAFPWGDCPLRHASRVWIGASKIHYYYVYVTRAAMPKRRAARSSNGRSASSVLGVRAKANFTGRPLSGGSS